MVNEHGELEVETERGTVKFTKPLAYQEINGKKVEVEVEYRIQGSGDRSKIQDTGCKIHDKESIAIVNHGSDIMHHSNKSKIRNLKLEYGFKVAAYDRTKDLIIDPLLASTYLGGSSGDGADSIAIDSDSNI